MPDSSSGYDGFLVDLMNQLARDMNVEYVLKPRETKGYFNETTSQWNGMIGDILREVGEKTITFYLVFTRETVTKYTSHFCNDIPSFLFISNPILVFLS